MIRTRCGRRGLRIMWGWGGRGGVRAYGPPRYGKFDVTLGNIGEIVLNQLLSFSWHDVELHEVAIDRLNRENFDIIRLNVRWGPWGPKPEEELSCIEFSNCYRLEAAMNFGVVGVETLRSAWLEPDHREIARLQTSLMVRDLFCMAFETNSTGSIIKIIASSVTVRPLP